ncbi:hypothetical protein [Sphingomonas abaci]|uniref:Uncharacterized protein n=1 Tax=Sphingomonas abaci TaxID=237611 RepID=A0A7W7AKD2_9SPHN|nr:hypothetical protein [Sphingomonas abaci]MBB4618638.1 hypothetical protein [Sphingomonas abaci]
MTDTTTDAAEARAREVREIDRIGTLLLNEWKRVDPSSGVALHPTSYIANFADMARVVIADRLATAEAASGAGEREWRGHYEAMADAAGALKDAIRPQLDAMQFADHVEVRKAFNDIAVVAGRALDTSQALASLPPATDPAMVERIARLLCQQHGADPEATATEEHDCWEGQLWTVFQDDARSILALAAAPTIPATGEAEA